MFEILKRRALMIMLLGSLMVSYLMHASWNHLNAFNEKKYDIKNDSTMKFFIDECTFNDNKIFVRGWVFNNTYPVKGHLIINVKINNKEYVIPSKTTTRPDVSTAFKLNNERARYGFYGALSLSDTSIKKPTITLNIINKDVISKDEYVCH